MRFPVIRLRSRLLGCAASAVDSTSTEIVQDGRGFILEVDRRSPNGRKECVLAIPTSLAKTLISGREPKEPDDRSDYQEAIDEVESAQVAKR